MDLSKKIIAVCVGMGLVIALAGLLVPGGPGAMWMGFAAALAFVLLAVPLSLVVRGGLSATALQVREAADDIADGNLNVAMDKGADGPLGEMQNAVARMADNLISRIAAAEGELENLRGQLTSSEDFANTCRSNEEESVRRLSDIRRVAREASKISERVAYASEGLTSQIAEVGEGTSLQRDRMAETASSMEEMNATVLEVARNASDSSSSAESAREKALEGAEIVSQAVTAIARVNELSMELKDNMDQLGQQAEGIGAVMNVITDIADQTNLLALNAAIEAARAGDAGRGFAVVADEVRKLAEKTMSATQEVGDSIKAIQSATERNIFGMDQATQAVDKATALANSSGEALNEIVSLVEASAGQAQSIAAASEEQSAASEEINQAVDEVNRVAAETAEGMRASSQAVRDLAASAAELQSLFDELVGSDQSKLAHSETQMRGILLKIMQDFLANKYGKEVRNAVMDELGSPSFLANRSYPDAAVNQIADLTAEKAGLTREQVLYDFGFHTPIEFKRLYRRYFKTDDLKEFYLSMNETHAQLTKEQPGITPPKFTYEDKGDVLYMTYHSSRALFSYFEGILNGVADLFGQPVTIRVTPQGPDSARAEIRF